jgi:hypothetical protein
MAYEKADSSKADLKPYSIEEFSAQYIKPAMSAADPAGIHAYYDPKFIATLTTQTPLGGPSEKKTVNGISVEEYADYMNWTQPPDSVEALTATGMQQVLESIAKKAAMSLDNLLSGALGAFSPMGEILKFPPPTSMAPRQGSLFDSKAYPPEHWFYQIEVKFRKFHQDAGEVVWEENWTALSMHKGLHRSKARALKVIIGLMSIKKIYADPEYFQWRVVPIHYGMTYTKHVQMKLKHREKVAAIRAQAALEYRQNQLRALEYERFEKEHQKNMKAHQLDAGIYKWDFSGPHSGPSSEGTTGNVLTVSVSPNYGKSIASLVPNPQGPPAIDVGKSPFKGWAVGLDCPATGPDGLGAKMHAVQKAKQAEMDAAFYAVQPPFVIHPAQYNAMLEMASDSSP